TPPKTEIVKGPEAPPIKPEIKEAIAKEIKNSIGMRLVYIPPGTYRSGSPPEEDGRKVAATRAGAVEEDQREEEIATGFYLGVYEVTQEEFETIMGYNRSQFKGARSPVESVSWTTAKEFCQKLSAKEGKHYRLPTEAEWEYACRAGTKTAFNVGAKLAPADAN